MPKPVTINGEPISDGEAKRILVALLDAKISISRDLELRSPLGRAPDVGLWQKAVQDMELVQSLIARLTDNERTYKFWLAGKVTRLVVPEKPRRRTRPTHS